MTFERIFEGSTADELILTTDSGNEIRIAKLDVREITTVQTYGDSLTNGALIGGGIGLGVALGILCGCRF